MNSLRSALLIFTLTSAICGQTNASEMVIRLKEKVPFSTLQRQVSDPTSPRRGRFYTPDEIKEISGPSDLEYKSLVDSLTEAHFEITSQSKTHLLLGIRPSPAFYTEASSARAQIAKVIKNAPNLIASVSGINPSRKLHPHFRLAPINGYFAVNQEDLKKAYGFQALYQRGLSGKGQGIAIATYDAYHPEDISQFFAHSGISPAPVIELVLFNGVPKLDESSAKETELDAELAGMIAPGAQIRIFASADNSDAGELQLFNAILDDNRSKTVNYSWGTCEADTNLVHKNDMDALYARAQAQGMNVIVGSGDSAQDGCLNGTQSASWPASSPQVISVGGTQFHFDGHDLAKTGWNKSGGGVSQFYDLPEYQKQFQSPFIKRAYPDVAFNADPQTGEQVWIQAGSGVGHWTTVGGTGMAAPHWAGFLALVGEARSKIKKAPLGFLNPILYSLSEKERALYLHDIQSGNNGYPAGRGWDAVTGLGSMRGDKLLEFLTAHP